MKAVTFILVVVSCIASSAPHAFADSPQARTDSAAPEQPPAAAYWFSGLLSGALVGAGGGYLHEREGDQELSYSNWKNVGIWGGAGAAAGLTLGLVLAAGDRNDPLQAQGAYVLITDLVGGTVLGTVVGGLAGVFYDGATEETQHAKYGAALGALIGAGLGFVVGLTELPTAYEKAKQRRFNPTVSSVRDGNNRHVWIMGAAGRF